MAKFQLKKLDLKSAKGDELRSKFLRSGSFIDGVPEVVAINAIENPSLAVQHEQFRAYLEAKNGEAPKTVELFHGTNSKILGTIYTHGLLPPSDMKPSDECNLSGGKGLCTSLCDNRCTKCTERHHWDKCHMFGLGNYLADIACKSHRYVSNPEALPGGRRRYRMIVCSVLMGRVLELEGHLKERSSLHDLPSLRRLRNEELEAAVQPHSSCSLLAPGCPPVDQHDLLFVKGLQRECKPGLSVFNSEFISFHPYQCLPRYEIVYDI